MTQLNPQYPAHADAPRSHARLLVPATVILVIFAIITAIFGGNKAGNDKKAADGVTDACKNIAGVQAKVPAGYTVEDKVCTKETTPPPNPNAITIASLTADYNNPSVSCVTLVRKAGSKVIKDVYLYDVGVRKAVQRGDPHLRQWTKAVEVPLPGGTPAAKRQNLMTAICLDPWLGSLWAHAESTWQVGNVSVLAHNTWLRPFADVNMVNDRAAFSGATFVPKKNLPEAQATAYVKQNKAWQRMAGTIDTIIGQLNPTEIKALPASKNWDVAGSGLIGKGLPEAELNTSQPDNLKALVLDVTQKGACAPLARFGANVNDMRPEVFPTPTCKSKPHQPGHPGTSTTPGGGKGGPPSTPVTHPVSSPRTCSVCVSKTSASQHKPSPVTGPVKSTGGSGPSNSSHSPTAPGGKPSGPTEPVHSSAPGGGGNNSSSQPPAAPTCGPLSNPYKPCG